MPADGRQRDGDDRHRHRRQGDADDHQPPPSDEADQPAEEEPGGHRGDRAQRQQQSDGAGGEAAVGAERGQVDERDVDRGEHDAAHQEGAEEAGQPQQRAHAAARRRAAAAVGGRDAQERGRGEQDGTPSAGGGRGRSAWCRGVRPEPPSRVISAGPIACPSEAANV